MHKIREAGKGLRALSAAKDIVLCNPFVNPPCAEASLGNSALYLPFVHGCVEQPSLGKGRGLAQLRADEFIRFLNCKLFGLFDNSARSCSQLVNPPCAEARAVNG